jgi:hypothetical protein
MKSLNLVLISLLLAATPLLGQKNMPPFHRVEPPFWWIGMKNSSLQILLYNNSINISDYTVSINYKGVALKGSRKVANPHYLFLRLEIAPECKPGKIPIQFVDGRKKFTYSYELKARIPQIVGARVLIPQM